MESGKRSDLATYRRVLLEARPLWWHIAGLFVVSLLATPLTLLTPWPLKIVVDSVLGDHELPRTLSRFLPSGTNRTDALVLAIVAALPIAFALANHIIDLAFAALRSYTGEKLVLTFR